MINSLQNNKKANLLKKLIYLINLSNRKHVFVLLILMVLATVLEVLGLGIIVPLLSIVIDTVSENQSVNTKFILNYFGNPPLQTLIIFISIGLVLFYFFKVLFLMFVEWCQYKFIYYLQSDLSKILLRLYLFRPFFFHKKNNSSQLIRNILSEISLFAAIVLNTAVLTIELLVIISISLILIFFQPFSFFLISSCLLVLCSIFYILIRKKIFEWGKNRQFNEGMRLQYLQESLGSYKLIKLNNKENYFINKFNKHNFNIANITLKQSFLKSLPRLSLEFLAVLAFAILVISLIFQNTSIDKIIPILALYAAACFRLLPSINRILSSIQIIRFAEPSINLLYDEFIKKNEINNKSDNIFFKNKIEFKDISFQYEDAEKPVLKNINIEIPFGSMIGIVGESGSGKSTIIDLLTGLLNPTKGKILADNKCIYDDIKNWQNTIGYVPQDVYFTDDTISANVAFGLNKDDIDKNLVLSTLDTVKLTKSINQLPLGIDTVIGESGFKLSGGQRQRISIARALYTLPEIIILDESTSALDFNTENSIIETITKFKGSKTIILVSHRQNTIINCDKIFEFKNGALIETNN